MTQYSVGATVTSTAVVSVNQTGEAMFGRPFIVRRQFGYVADQPTTVLTGNSSAVVHARVFHGEAAVPDS